MPRRKRSRGPLYRCPSGKRARRCTRPGRRRRVRARARWRRRGARRCGPRGEERGEDAGESHGGDPAAKPETNPETKVRVDYHDTRASMAGSTAPAVSSRYAKRGSSAQRGLRGAAGSRRNPGNSRWPAGAREACIEHPLRPLRRTGVTRGARSPGAHTARSEQPHDRATPRRRLRVAPPRG